MYLPVNCHKTGIGEYSASTPTLLGTAPAAVSLFYQAEQSATTLYGAGSLCCRNPRTPLWENKDELSGLGQHLLREADWSGFRLVAGS